MRLSIAMIVKNEEKYLEQCLLSTEKLKNKIDYELIIVDTGSTDNTIDIAKKFTDNVYEEKWNNDFSYMRNLSISYCSGDWILILDADEVLENSDELVKMLLTNDIDKYNSIGIYQKNLQNGMDAEDYSITSVFRLLKRNKDFKFEGTIHEQPNIIYPMKDSTITLLHYGYNNDSFEKLKYRNERNKKLLEKELREGNMDKIYVLFQLARTYINEKDKSKAFRCIKRSYDLDKRTPGHHLTTCKQYALQVYNRSDYKQCIEVFDEVKEYFKEDLDYYYFGAMSHLKLNNYSKAEQLFVKYFMLYDRKKQGKSFISQTGEDSIKCIDGAKVNYVKCLFIEKKYEEVIIEYEALNNDIAMERLTKEYIHSSIKCNKYYLLKDYLKTNYNDNVMNIVSSVFDNLYSEDFNLRDLLGINNNIDKYISTVYLYNNKYDLDEIDYNDYYLWKGRVIAKSILKDRNKLSYLEGLSVDDSFKYINYLNINYNTIDIMLDYVDNNYLLNSKRNLVYAIQKVLIYNKLIVKDKFDKLIKQTLVTNYILICDLFCSNNYSATSNLDFVEQMLDKYSLLWLDIFRILKNINVTASISRIKKLLKSNPKHTRIIEYFINDKIIKSNSVLLSNPELNKEKNRIIKVVENMVSSDKINQAFLMINELFNMYPYDGDILLNRGVILYLLGNVQEAIVNLSLSYIFLKDKFEVSYNIAMVLETNGQLECSIEYYKKSYEICKDEEIKNGIKLKIDTLCKC